VNAGEPLTIAVSSLQSFAPTTLVVRIHVAPDVDNRALVVTAESGESLPVVLLQAPQLRAQEPQVLLTRPSSLSTSLSLQACNKMRDNSPLMSEMLKRAITTMREAERRNPLEDAPTVPTIPTEVPPTSTPNGNWPMIASWLGGLGDEWSTQRALAKGGHEQNPISPKGPLAIGLVGSALYGGNGLLAKYLTGHGHPQIGKTLGYGAGILGGLMTTHNTGPWHYPGERR
jgi:hypothetical protein